MPHLSYLTECTLPFVGHGEAVHIALKAFAACMEPQQQDLDWKKYTIHMVASGKLHLLDELAMLNALTKKQLQEKMMKDAQVDDTFFHTVREWVPILITYNHMTPLTSLNDKSIMDGFALRILYSFYFKLSPGALQSFMDLVTLSKEKANKLCLRTVIQAVFKASGHKSIFLGIDELLKSGTVDSAGNYPQAVKIISEVGQLLQQFRGGNEYGVLFTAITSLNESFMTTEEARSGTTMIKLPLWLLGFGECWPFFLPFVHYLKTNIKDPKQQETAIRTLTMAVVDCSGHPGLTDALFSWTSGKDHVKQAAMAQLQTGTYNPEALPICNPNWLNLPFQLLEVLISSKNLKLHSQISNLGTVQTLVKCGQLFLDTSHQPSVSVMSLVHFFKDKLKDLDHSLTIWTLPPGCDMMTIFDFQVVMDKEMFAAHMLSLMLDPSIPWDKTGTGFEWFVIFFSLLKSLNYPDARAHLKLTTLFSEALRSHVHFQNHSIVFPHRPMVLVYPGHFSSFVKELSQNNMMVPLNTLIYCTGNNPGLVIPPSPSCFTNTFLTFELYQI